MNAKKIFSYALGPLGGAILGFISLPLIAWYFPVEVVGKISTFQVAVSLSTLLFCLGLDQAYIREYYGHDNPARLLKTSLMPGLLLLILTVISLNLIDPSWIASVLFNEDDRYIGYMVYISLISVFITRFLSLILRMQERALAYSISQLLPRLLYAVIVVFYICIGVESNLYFLLFANLITLVAVLAVFLINTKRDWLPGFSLKINYKELKELLRFGLPLVVGGFASWGLNAADKMSLRYLSSFQELGVYSVSLSIAGIASIFTGVFNLIWAPLVYKWVKSGERNYAKIDQISEHVLAALYFVVIFMGLFSWIVSYLLPAVYTEVVFLLPVSVMAPLLYSLSETTSVGINIAKKTILSMIASVLAMVLNVIGNLVLVPILGARGAAASTLAAFLLFYILRTEFSRRVWRKMPVVRVYLILIVLFTYVQINLFITRGNFVHYLVTTGLILIGLVVFKQSLMQFKLLFFSLTRKAASIPIG